MADQDWKTGPLNRNKYVVHKTCQDCDGTGSVQDDNTFFGASQCPFCNGKGILPSSKDARYFVLRIDGNNDPNARLALSYYAECVRSTNHEFADDIRAWLKEAAEAGKEGEQLPGYDARKLEASPAAREKIRKNCEGSQRSQESKAEFCDGSVDRAAEAGRDSE